MAADPLSIIPPAESPAAGALEADVLPPVLDPINLSLGSLTAVDSRFPGRYTRLGESNAFRAFLNVGLEYVILEGLAMVLFSYLKVRNRTDLDGQSFMSLLGMTVLVAPLIETLFFQALFCAIGRKVGLSFWPLVAFTLIPFAAIHYTVSIGTGVAAGTILGFYLSVTYVVNRSVSFKRAFFRTAAFHALNNLIAVSLMVYFRQP